ncbi:hypothetical protein CW700_01135 [Candidatus Bathyarchaeota archaeon]|nr:MAG: hypothetical protein CW700_01135 [Candidatus Bathyarchaeota archaeon]
MPVELVFSLTPKNPKGAAIPGTIVSSGYAAMWFRNCYIGADSHSLEDQFAQDYVRLYGNPAPEEERESIVESSWKYGTVRVQFYAYGPTPKNQYLVFFNVRGAGGAKVAVYVDGNRVAVEPVEGEEHFGIIVDCPESGEMMDIYLQNVGRRFSILDFYKCEINVL